MANISIKETDGSDQDTLAPLPRPAVPWGSAPPAYSSWRPPYPMPQQMAENHPYNPAMFQVPSVTGGSGSPRSASSGSQKSREKEVDRESRSSGGSSASERSGSSKGDRASIKERPKDSVSLPPMRDYGRLETMPDNMAASRSSFQIALANPCELFVDVM